MLDKDMVNIISHLYHHGKITDEVTKQVLHCYFDTVGPLQGGGVVSVKNGEWELAPGVLAFLKLADASLNAFPPKHWIFGGQISDPLTKPQPKTKCFLAMPYGPNWFTSVRDVVEDAVTTAGYEFDIAADISKPGNIMQQVWGSIRQAPVVIADLTGLNANVMYEVGVAHALGKQVVLITQEPSAIPFDIRGNRWYAYRLTELADLDKWLQTSLGEVATELALPVSHAH